MTPQTMSIRIVFLCGMAAGQVCYIAYSANLIKILSNEEKVVSSPDDILRLNLPIYCDYYTHSADDFMEVNHFFHPGIFEI